MDDKETHLSRLPKGAQRIIKWRRLRVRPTTNYKSRKKKYTKQQFLELYLGYDFLENLDIVRRYIMAQYNMKHAVFEMILKMAAKENQYFTIEDYKSMVPENFTTHRFSELIADGWLVEVTKNKSWSKGRIFSLSTHARFLNTMIYEMLSGERKIPTYSNNVFSGRKKSPAEKKTFELIKKMNITPVPETRRKFFE